MYLGDLDFAITNFVLKPINSKEISVVKRYFAITNFVLKQYEWQDQAKIMNYFAITNFVLKQKQPEFFFQKSISFCYNKFCIETAFRAPALRHLR